MFVSVDRTESGCLKIPVDWLCYLAPEIMRKLTPVDHVDDDDLPFTVHSDVYAFG